MKSEAAKGALILVVAVLLIVGVYSSKFVFKDPDPHTVVYSDAEKSHLVEKHLESIEGVFDSGVLRGTTYDVEEVGTFRILIRLERYGENVSVLYKLSTPTQKAGWESLYGELQPEVEQELEAKFRPMIDNLVEFYKKKEAFRRLIYSYE